MSPAAGPPPATRLHRNFAALAGGEAAARLVAFAATVYLARTLGAGVYGAVAFASAVILYFTYIADFGLETLGIRDVAAGRAADPAFVPSLVLGRLAVAAGCLVVLAVAAATVVPPLEGALLAALALTLLTAASSVKWVLLGLQRAGGVAIARTAGEVVAALLLVALVRDAGDVGLVPLALFAGAAAGGLLMLRSVRRAGVVLVVIRDGAAVREVFGRSWPLVLQALLSLVTFNSDLIFLRTFRDAATVGYYAAAYALISFLMNLGVAFGQSLLPALTQAGADAAAEGRLYRRALRQVVGPALPLAAAGSFLAPTVVSAVFSTRYALSADALQVLLWSVPLGLARTVAQTALIARGRQREVMQVAAWAAAGNILLNAALIPRFGMTGAAAATVATEVLRVALTLRYAARAGLGLARN